MNMDILTVLSVEREDKKKCLQEINIFATAKIIVISKKYLQTQN